MGRGRKKKVPPELQHLGPVPPWAFGNSQTTFAILRSIDTMKAGIQRVFGGVGIKHMTAYEVHDLDADSSEHHRRRVLDELRAEQSVVEQWRARGTESTKTASAAKCEDAQRRLGEMVVRLRSRGATSRAIATQIGDREGVSLSTAKRWLKAWEGKEE